MKSYTTLRNLYGSLTNNIETANLTLGDQIINDSYRAICSMKDWPFLQRLRSLSTVASTQSINLPYDIDQVREVSVVPTGQTTRYVPRNSPSQEHWDRLNLSTFTSDIPEWWFTRAGKLLLWPTPASTGNTVDVVGKIRVTDLNVADITTTTISAIANGAVAMTVNAGLTAQMAGFYIRPTFSTTANTGDGQWYEIASVASATACTLARAYGGTTIAAGTAACTISQMPLLPEAFHETPVKRAVSQYWAQQLNSSQSLMYERQYKDSVAELIRNWSNPTTDMIIDDGRYQPIINPNLNIFL